MSNYDTWLSTNPADRAFPTGVEDTLGTIIMWPEGIDEDTLIPEFGEVTDYEAIEPEAEGDGEGGVSYSGGGVNYLVVNLNSSPRRQMWIRDDEVAEHAVPAELDPIIEKMDEARRAKREAEYAFNRYDNARRQVGFNAEARRTEAARKPLSEQEQLERYGRLID
jgi:hypothetical protein